MPNSMGVIPQLCDKEDFRHDTPRGLHYAEALQADAHYTRIIQRPSRNVNPESRHAVDMRRRSLLDQVGDAAGLTAPAGPTLPVNAAADNVTAQESRQTSEHRRRQRLRDRFAPGNL